MRLSQIFPVSMRAWMEKTDWQEQLEEVRVRTGQPLQFIYGDRKCFLCGSEGEWKLIPEQKRDTGKLYRMTGEQVREMIRYISSYSLYAYKEELSQGYLTMEGGHRVGIAGQAVVSDGRVTGISPVTFLNIRVAHEKIGSAKIVLPWILHGRTIYNTLVFSAPGAGKTTLLRDLIRSLSNGEACGDCVKTGVVDERSEIAAASHGVPQNDLGPVTDVLSGCNKAEGMQMMIRSMSPEVLAVDELGGEKDFMAVEEALNCGIRVIGTVHAGDVKELKEKKHLRGWLEKGYFERFLCLKKEADGTRRVIVYDGKLRQLEETG